MSNLIHTLAVIAAAAVAGYWAGGYAEPLTCTTLGHVFIVAGKCP